MTDDSNEVKPFFSSSSYYYSPSSLKRTHAYDYLFEFPPEYTLQLSRAEVGLPVVVAAGHRAFLRFFFFFFLCKVLMKGFIIYRVTT